MENKNDSIRSQENQPDEGEHRQNEIPKEQQIGHVPKNLKDSGAAQFLYGRMSEKATEHFDRTSKRLEHGNPDIGEVDLGEIDVNEPSKLDDLP